MNLQLVFVFAFLAFVQVNGQQSTASTCGRRWPEHTFSRLPRMTNAFQADLWPWHAAIYQEHAYVRKYKCGGTLISSNLILTAAHSVSRYNTPIKQKKVFVSLGKLNLDIYESSSQSFKVDEIILHPEFNAINLRNNIAIIKLSKKATFTKYVQPVCLWNRNKTELSEVIGKNGMVIGWGGTVFGAPSNALQQASMSVIDFFECLTSNPAFFGSLLTDKSFCAGFRNGVRKCDRGGSMTFEANGQHYIRGIVSAVALTRNKDTQEFVCDIMQYVIFTDVAKYLPWIDAYLAKECEHHVACNSDVVGKDNECKILLHTTQADEKCEIFYIELNTNHTGLVINGQLEVFPNFTINEFERLSSLNLTTTKLRNVERANLVPFNRIQHLSLSKNIISKLAADTFDDLKDLSDLIINGNQLQKLHRDQFKELRNLTSIDLNKNQLKDLPPKLFQNNQNLQKIWLQDNEIHVLYGDNFKELRDLTTLHLNNNHLKELPEDVFKDLHSLTTLHLQHNQLKWLPEGIFRNNDKLVEIRLHNNKINEIRRELFNDLHNLQTLHLNNNQLEQLPEGVFNRLLNLKELNLHKNRLRSLPNETFRYNKKLETIRLHENRIKCLTRNVLEGLHNLTNIYLHKNHLDSLPNNTFQHNPKLEEILLQDNAIEDLHEDVFVGLHRLEKLNLYNNRLEILPDGVFKDLHNLIALHLDSNGLDSLPDGIFQNNKKLKEIRLQDNQIDVLNQNLFDGLRNLATLRLDNNQLERLPKELLKDLHNLRELNLNANQLETLPDGLFRNNTKLEEIWLRANKIQVIECDFNDLANLVRFDLSGNECIKEYCEFKSSCREISFCGEISLRQMSRKIWNLCH